MSAQADRDGQAQAPVAAPVRTGIGWGDAVLAFLSCRDNLLYVLLCLGLVGAGLASGPRWSDGGWFLLGWIAFLPQEWLTHVYVLHWTRIRGEGSYRWMYRLHYGHHDFPRRDDLMYMPLWLTVPMTLANLALFLWLCPGTRAGLAAFAGAMLGYIVFEWSHLLCHLPLVPRSALWRRIRERHLAHHFVNETRWYSVSPPAQFIDRLTGKAGARAAAPRSGSTRHLIDALDPGWLARARERFAHRSSGDLEQSALWLRHSGLKRGGTPQAPDGR